MDYDSGETAGETAIKTIGAIVSKILETAAGQRELEALAVKYIGRGRVEKRRIRDALRDALEAERGDETMADYLNNCSAIIDGKLSGQPEPPF